MNPWIERVEKLLAAATKGPWGVVGTDSIPEGTHCVARVHFPARPAEKRECWTTGEIYAPGEVCETRQAAESNAALIAAAPTLLPRAVEREKALRRVIEAQAARIRFLQAKKPVDTRNLYLELEAAEAALAELEERIR